MIEISLTDTGADDALKRLMAAMQDTEPAMRAIGETVMEISKRSFDNSASPDGTPWASNTEATILHYLEQTGGNYKKDGRLSAKGAQRVMNKKPLIGQSRDLQRQFSYSATADSVTITNNMVYAAMQQFGGTKQEFPNLWGDIPARPFMPIDAEGNLMKQAEEEINTLMSNHFSQLTRG